MSKDIRRALMVAKGVAAPSPETYKDPRAPAIAGWKWRPLKDVHAELGNIREIPSHVVDFGRFMDDTAKRAGTQGLTPRDLIKAYAITLASIQRRAQDVGRIRAAGLPLEGITGKIRPEGAMGEWLHTPAGQSYLDAASRGQAHEGALKDMIERLRPFGMAPKLAEGLQWGAENLPGKEGLVSNLVAAGREKASSPDEWRDFAKGLRGIDVSKAGFVASMLGRGDQPTFDARQRILQTGLTSTEAGEKIAGPKMNPKARAAVDRLASRQAAMNLSLPKELDPYYQHLAHHTIWDKASGEETTHQDVINAMQHAAYGGAIERNPIHDHPLTHIMRAIGLPGLDEAKDTSSVHPASQIPGVHISERTHGKPIFTGERVGKEGGGSLTGKDEDGEDGITAYHSSPHDIGPEGFSNDKIGTGEGAQMYGHGHYFAEHPAVSGQGGQYWNNFYHKMPRGVEKRAASVLESARFDRNAAITLSEKLRDEHLESAANGPEEDKEGHRLLAEDRNSAAEYLRSGKIAGPRTYEVRIQGRPEHFLDWDAPIDEQSPHVIQALEKADWWPYAREGADELADRHGQNAAGSDIMRWLHDDWTKPEASQMLSDLGIRGIRFLDQGSRPEGKGTRNYVVFDPKHIDIQRRYARGGMAYADGGSVPPNLRSKMLAAYNETLPSIERQYKDWAREADDAALHKVTADDIESNYGEDDEIHPRDAEAIKIARQKGHVIAESRNGETTYHDPDKAPTLEQHMQAVVEDQGGKRPARDLSDLDYSHTSGIHDALMELAQHHGWKKQATQGNKYFDLVHPQKGRIGVRIADHPNTSRQGPVNRDAAEVNLNLAPKSRPDAPAHNLDDAAQMLSAQSSGPRRAYGDGGSLPDAGVQKALDLTRDLNPQGLYSHAAEAAMASPQAKGPLPQMLASLKGVKPDELKYSGVQQAFADKPRVTREELAGHFQKSLPDIEETTLREGGNEGPTKFSSYTMPGGENYREVLMGLPISGSRDTHYNSHWPKQNVLAHLRLKDRTGPNGEKILHAEEIQSDWGQQARKQGTYDSARPYQVFETTTGKVLSEHPTLSEAKAEKAKRFDAGEEGIDYGHPLDTYTDKEPAPSGPYIGNTQGWTDLALKRLLHEAAAGGYDKVVWTPGAEQGRRYNVVQQAEAMRYFPESGIFQIKHPHDVFGSARSGLSKDEMIKRYGRENIERLLSQPLNEDNAHELRGNIEYGGEGMKGYYDKVVPKSLLALAKQHDPDAKLEMGRLPVQNYNISTPDIARELGMSIEEVNALPHDEKWAAINSVRHSISAPGLTITPRMRESILKKGFKAYARGGEVQGFKDGGDPPDPVPARMPLTFSDADINKALAITRVGNPQQAALMAAKHIGDLTTRSNLSSRVHRPIEDMSATYVPTEQLSPETPVPWEKTQGSRMMAAPGDRTMGGHALTHVGGKELSFYPSLEGGYDFSRSQAGQKEDAGWASGLTVTSGMGKQIRREAEKGQPLILSHVAMSGESGDFSHMMADTLLAQMPASKITKKAKKEFDKDMRSVEEPSVAKSWPGIDAPNLRQHLHAHGPSRYWFSKVMDQSKHQDAGFPSAAEARYAITANDLINVPSGQTGQMFVRLDPEGAVFSNLRNPHSTYPTQIKTQGYMGRPTESLPRDVAFRDWHNKRREMGKDPRGDERSFNMSRDVSQVMDQEQIDHIMGFLERRKRGEV